MEEAHFLTKYGSKVYIIHRRDELRASKLMQERAFADPKLEIVWNSRVAEIVGEDSRLARAVHELAVSVEHSLNIVVVRTPPGGAQYLASAFDGAHWGSILGTVAGDDTVLMVTRGADAGAEVAEAIVAMAEGRAGGSAR